MRSKKTVLLAISDEQLLGDLFVLLYVNNYLPIKAESAQQALELLGNGYHLLIADNANGHDSASDQLIVQAKTNHPTQPVILLVKSVSELAETELSPADERIVLPLSIADFLHRVKFKTIQKKGPKRGFRFNRAPANQNTEDFHGTEQQNRMD
jgi:DNA-binding NtrC family response regulator